MGIQYLKKNIQEVTEMDNFVEHGWWPLSHSKVTANQPEPMYVYNETE